MIACFDIALVIVLFYIMIHKVKGTRTIQMIKGFSIVISFYLICRSISINLLSNILNPFISNCGIVLMVIFQPEIRKGLELLGRGNLGLKYKGSNNDIINYYDKAIQYMSKRKIGALITIERNTNLDQYAETGIKLNADMTGELLINIFIPNTPLHDGAVIVRGRKVLVSCAYLPLSENEDLSKEFGTRHRAALGISEVTDAITIIVSEETGDVSLSYDNMLLNSLRREEYLAILTEKMVMKKLEEKGVPKSTLFQLPRRFLELVNQGLNSSFF